MSRRLCYYLACWFYEFSEDALMTKSEFHYIDSHAHLEADRFDEDREAVIERALAAGVAIIVNVGNGDVARHSHEAAFKRADSYPFIYTTVGVHPHEASLLDDALFARLVEWSHHPKVIAWGE